MKIKIDTIIRTVLLFVALVNQFLIMTGHSVLPIDDQELTELLSTGFTIVTASVAWWKNNSFTSRAIEADEYLKNVKEMDANEID